MRPARDVRDYLQDMVDAAAKAELFLGKLSLDEFNTDERTVFAVIRALEILGEAAKHIPTELRGRYPDVPWRLITGLRDKVAHDYLSVDLALLYVMVRRDLPVLRPALQRVLADLSNGP